MQVALMCLWVSVFTHRTLSSHSTLIWDWCPTNLGSATCQRNSLSLWHAPGLALAAFGSKMQPGADGEVNEVFK